MNNPEYEIDQRNKLTGKKEKVKNTDFSAKFKTINAKIENFRKLIKSGKISDNQKNYYKDLIDEWDKKTLIIKQTLKTYNKEDLNILEQIYQALNEDIDEFNDKIVIKTMENIIADFAKYLRQTLQNEMIRYNPKTELLDPKEKKYKTRVFFKAGTQGYVALDKLIRNSSDEPVLNPTNTSYNYITAVFKKFADNKYNNLIPKEIADFEIHSIAGKGIEFIYTLK